MEWISFIVIAIITFMLLILPVSIWMCSVAWTYGQMKTELWFLENFYSRK